MTRCGQRELARSTLGTVPKDHVQYTNFWVVSGDTASSLLPFGLGINYKLFRLEDEEADWLLAETCA